MTRILALAVLLAAPIARADPPAKVDLVKALVDAGDWRKHDLAPPAPASYIITIDRDGIHGPRGPLHGMAAGAMFASGLALMAAHADSGGCNGALCAIAIGLVAIAATIETAAKDGE